MIYGFLSGSNLQSFGKIQFHKLDILGHVPGRSAEKAINGMSEAQGDVQQAGNLE